MTEPRRAKIERKTKESDIVVELDLDGTGVVDVDTGVPFFDHMLTSLGSHASLDLTVQAKGDIEIEGHHTIEDTAIVLGQALGKALARRSATMARRLVGSTRSALQSCSRAAPVAGTPTAAHRQRRDMVLHNRLGSSIRTAGRRVGEQDRHRAHGRPVRTVVPGHRRASALRQYAASRTVARAAHVEHA